MKKLLFVIGLALLTTFTAVEVNAQPCGRVWVEGHHDRYGRWVPRHWRYLHWVPGHYNHFGEWVPGHCR
jgi:hypothetical protein